MRQPIRNRLAQAGMMAATIALAVALGSQAPVLYRTWRGSSEAGDFALHVANQAQRYTLYGTSSCPYCAKARAYLTQAGIPFNDRNIETSREANEQFSLLRETGVPVLVSEKKLIRGFDELEYAALTPYSVPFSIQLPKEKK